MPAATVAWVSGSMRMKEPVGDGQAPGVAAGAADAAVEAELLDGGDQGRDP